MLDRNNGPLRIGLIRSAGITSDWSWGMDQFKKVVTYERGRMDLDIHLLRAVKSRLPPTNSISGSISRRDPGINVAPGLKVQPSKESLPLNASARNGKNLG